MATYLALPRTVLAIGAVEAAEGGLRLVIRIWEMLVCIESRSWKLGDYGRQI